MKALRRCGCRLSAVALCAVLAACGGSPSKVAAPGAKDAAMKADVQAKADAFLKAYLGEFARLEKTQTTAYWQASNSGKKEDFDVAAKAELELRKLHSSATRYAQLQELLAHRDALDPLTARSLEVAELSFKGNQLSSSMLEKMVKASSEIEQIFNTYRGMLDGKRYTNNDLLEMLAKEKDSARRQSAWEALKQVGEQVAPRLIALAKVRNEAARQLGYGNYWEMQVRLQEHDPARIAALFDELEKLTERAVRRHEGAARSGAGAQVRNRARADDALALRQPLLSGRAAVGQGGSRRVLPGQEQGRHCRDRHAFLCGHRDSDRSDRGAKRPVRARGQGSARVLHRHRSARRRANAAEHQARRPTGWTRCSTRWGTRVYYELLDYELPYNLRESAHIFTTEGIAMLFGALASNPKWLVTYAGASEQRVLQVAEAIREQRRREQLIFTRWVLVMLNFERALYEDPDQDLNTCGGIWWSAISRSRVLRGARRPTGHQSRTSRSLPCTITTTCWGSSSPRSCARS